MEREKAAVNARDIFMLYAKYGQADYLGEPVSQLEQGFMRAYDDAAEETRQRKKLKMINIVLAVFIIITICMLSVLPQGKYS